MAILIESTNYNSLNSVWDQLISSCNYPTRLKAVNDYNSKNRWTKRGMSLVPLKYGISWAARYGCDVNIYIVRFFSLLQSPSSLLPPPPPKYKTKDGTVGIIHSGILPIFTHVFDNKI